MQSVLVDAWDQETYDIGVDLPHEVITAATKMREEIDKHMKEQGMNVDEHAKTQAQEL